MLNSKQHKASASRTGTPHPAGSVLAGDYPDVGMVFAHLMLPEDHCRTAQASGRTTRGRRRRNDLRALLGFSGVMAFWGGLGIILGAASAAFSNVLLKARAIQLAPAMMAAWQMIFGAAPCS